MVLTNKTNVEFNYDNIIRDFDIYLIKKQSEKLDRTNVLDVPTQKFKALSVQYAFGQKAFVLFKKGTVNYKEFKDEIVGEYEDIYVQKIEPEELKDDTFRQNNFYYMDRLLAQLLINSIRVPQSEEFSYHNLTGKLLYSNAKWCSRDRKTKEIYMRYFIEISFDPGMFLNLDVKTFTKWNGKDKGRLYIEDPNTKFFRKKLKTDNEKNIFIDKGLANTRITIPYLNFKNFDDYKACKLGVLYQFITDVEMYLGDYMTLDLIPREDVLEYEESVPIKEMKNNINLGTLVEIKGINIVDEIKNDSSSHFVELLSNKLESVFGVSSMTGELNKAKYNIRILHDEEYYKGRNEDPHGDDLSGYIVQHITESSLEKFLEKNKNDITAANAIMTKLVQELLIKGDIYDKQLSIFDWKKINTNKEWTFVYVEKMKEVDEEIKVRDYYKNFYMVKIIPDGTLKFDFFNDIEFIDDDEKSAIQFAYDTFEKNSKAINNYVEGLVFSDLDNIHAIVRTKEKTMPGIAAIWSGLEESKPKTKLHREGLINAITAFSDNCPECKEYSDAVISKLKDGNGPITKDEVRKLINLRTNAGKDLNRFLHNNFGVRISAEMKDSDFKDVYRLMDVTNIKYFEETDYRGVNSFNYYVGTKYKSLQNSIHNASIVRKVVSQLNKLEFEELLPLMAVEFVKNNQYTVLPFPFKYLREYKALCDAERKYGR